MRMSQGAGGLQPLFCKTVIFRAKAKFLGQKPGAKMEKKHFFVFIKGKMEFILLSEIKCPKSGIFTKNYWVG